MSRSATRSEGAERPPEPAAGGPPGQPPGQVPGGAPGGPRGRPWRRGLRGLGRAVARALLAVVVLAGALAAVVLLSPAVRERLLREALLRADARLSGRFAWSRLAWTSPWRLEAADLLWTDGADTLVRVDRLDLALSAPALARRDLVVARAAAAGVAIDVPGVRARLPARAAPPASDAAPEEAAGVPFFPRPGALPRLPSLAVRELSLAGVTLVLAPGQAVRGGRLAGNVTLLAGETPLARVDSLAARDAAGQWEVADGSLSVDLREGVATARATGAAARWPFALAATVGRHGDYRLTLSGRDAPAPPAGPGVVATGRIERREDVPSGLTVAALIRTPGARELAGLLARGGAAASWPDLGGVTLAADGRFDWAPAPGGSFVLRVPAGVASAVGVASATDAAGDSLRARLAFAPGAVRVDSLAASWRGLAARGAWRLEGTEQSGRLAVAVRGIAWLQTLRPGLAGPESLAADLEAALAGPLNAPRAEARLAGGLRQGGFRLERAEATVAGALAPPGSPLAFTLAARALGFELTGGGTARLGDTLLVALPPLRLAAVPGGPRDHRAALAALREADEGARAPDVTGPPEGTVRFVPAAGTLRVRGLQVALDEDRVLVEADGAPADAAGPSRGLALRASLAAPGPGRLSPLAPPLPAARELGPLRAEAAFTPIAGAGPGAFDLRVDLGATAWIDTALAVVTRRGAVTAVESLAVALPGIALRGGGRAGADSVDFAGALEITDARTLRRFAPALDESSRVKCMASARVAGPARDPCATLALAGELAVGPLVVPAVTADAEWSGGRLRTARLAAPRGLAAGQLLLAEAAAAYADPEAVADAGAAARAPGSDADAETGAPATAAVPASPLPGTFTVSAHGPRLSWRQRARLERAPGAWVVRTDSLAVSLAGAGLAAQRPFEVAVADGGAGLDLRDLELGGSLGRVWGGGHAGADSTRFALEADLALPEMPPLPGWPRDLWPGRLALSLRADADSATAGARVEGLRLGPRADLEAELRLAGGAGGTRARATLGDARGEIARADAALPAAVRTWPPGLAVREGELSAALTLSDFPVVPPSDRRPWRGPAPLLSGRAELSGLAAAPALAARLRLAFPAAGGQPGHAAEIAARLTAPGAAVPALPDLAPAPGPAPVAPAAEPVSPAGALGAAWTISRGGAAVGDGALLLPLAWAPGPPARPVAVGDSLDARMQARSLPLSDLNYLLAGALSLDGRLSLDLAAAGPPLDPRLSGSLSLADLKARMDDGTWVLASGNLRLGGHGRRPSVRGSVQIDQGVLVVPEVRPALLPAAGEATLWRIAPADTSADERLAARLRPARADTAPALPPLDLEIGLSVPAGFWIRGRGLDVELAGDLEARQRDGAPAVLGELAAVRGQLTLLDRVFTVERGRAVFYGGAVIDPEIDLALSAQQDELLVRVLMTGTALQPDLRLTSEPEMAEGDIMARLVFGKPLDQLDETETGLVQDRAMSVAKSFATSRLEAMLSRQLGVDMLKLQTTAEGGRSVMVGKYLSRRALLRYQQSLQSDQAFALGLEYWLARRLKLETSLSRVEQSGLDLNWSRDY